MTGADIRNHNLKVLEDGNYEGAEVDAFVESTAKAFDELFNENKNNGAANLIHYVYDLHACPEDDEAELLALGIGHYSDEIEVPILDDEQLWLNHQEE